MMKRPIHKALQLEVCDQCNQKLWKGWLKVPQTDFFFYSAPNFSIITNGQFWELKPFRHPH